MTHMARSNYFLNSTVTDGKLLKNKGDILFDISTVFLDYGAGTIKYL